MLNEYAYKTQKKTQGGLLESAFYNYKVLSMSYRLPFAMFKKYVCDGRVRVGINIGKYVLAATPTNFGDKVSVNEKVWRCRKPIILYLGEKNIFYLIKQKEVKEKEEMNFENCTIIKFDFHGATNLTKLFPEYTPEEKERKMMGY